MADAAVAAVQALAQRAASVCVLTGAGMSAESGIATFRDAMSGTSAKSRVRQMGAGLPLQRTRAALLRQLHWRALDTAEGAEDAAIAAFGGNSVRQFVHSWKYTQTSVGMSSSPEAPQLGQVSVECNSGRLVMCSMVIYAAQRNC